MIFIINRVIKSMTKILAFLTASLLTLCFAAEQLTPYELTINEHNNKILDSAAALSLRYDSDSVPADSGGQKNSKAEIMLFGSVPVKEVNINFDERREVIPGGTPFGIRIYTNGLVVAKTTEIQTADGNKNPANEAGIQCGDIILSVNGEPLRTNEQLLKCVENSGGESIKIEAEHNNEKYTARIKPVKDSIQNKYKIGLWVRDSCAGIGTMTYTDPETGMFGGLGHGICDSDSGSLMPLDHGDIVSASISSVKKSTCGSPGALSGYFTDSEPIGTLISNGEHGVYGSVSRPVSGKTVPVAYKQEIKKGKAKILSTIDGTRPEYYDIEIEDVSYNSNNNCKNMVIKVTDKNLLNKTGGIVQGMSGSPIIQNNMLVGAVTHVFVNDPTHGYAIFAETMLSQSNSVVQNGTSMVS